MKWFFNMNIEGERVTDTIWFSAVILYILNSTSCMAKLHYSWEQNQVYWFITVSQFLWQWYWTSFFLSSTCNHNHSQVCLELTCNVDLNSGAPLHLQKWEQILTFRLPPRPLPGIWLLDKQDRSWWALHRLHRQPT